MQIDLHKSLTILVSSCIASDKRLMDAFLAYLRCFTGEAKLKPTGLHKMGCVIKGNITSSGEKVFHVPGGRFYQSTKINTSAGERWFCSEIDAEKAGWRPSKQ